jgi:6-phosphogluconolactonase (cycloisomerase 2 family)
MKFGKVGQVALVSATALGVATLFTACGTLNVGFLFVATKTQTPGQIEVYEVDSESGSLRTIPTSPFPSGGRSPSAEAVGPVDYLNLYVTNEDDNNITQFGIGTDGKLYPQSTINTPGSYPLAIALNASQTFVYVLDDLGPVAGCSLANPCPGVVAGYAITPSNATVIPGSLGLSPASCATQKSTVLPAGCSLGNAVVNSNGLGYVPLQLSSSNTTTILTPTAMNVLASGSFLYVTAVNSATSTGYIFGFSVGSDGSLTPLNGGVPQVAGVDPVALTSDSNSQFVYVVDKATNQLDTYTVGSTGALTLTATTATGNQPSALTLFNNNLLYVTNSLDSTVTGYTVSNGALTNIATYATDADPIAIAGDPKHLGFLYTVNFLDPSLSGYKIDTTSGALINTQSSPYASSTQPTAIAGIPHGGKTTKAQ